MWRHFVWLGFVTRELRTSFIFLKILFQFKTCFKELISCTNNPNVHIRIFCKSWSFILRCFFPLSILKGISVAEKLAQTWEYVFKNFTKFTEKHLCQSLCYNKVVDLIRLYWKTLLKKRLWHMYFPVNFARFLRTPFLQNTFGQLFLVSFHSLM